MMELLHKYSMYKLSRGKANIFKLILNIVIT